MPRHTRPAPTHLNVLALLPQLRPCRLQLGQPLLRLGLGGHHRLLGRHQPQIQAVAAAPLGRQRSLGGPQLLTCALQAPLRVRQQPARVLLPGFHTAEVGLNAAACRSLGLGARPQRPCLLLQPPELLPQLSLLQAEQRGRRLQLLPLRGRTALEPRELGLQAHLGSHPLLKAAEHLRLQALLLAPQRGELGGHAGHRDERVRELRRRQCVAGLQAGGLL